MKRKSELRTIPLHMSLHKYERNLKSSSEQHWKIEKLQPFFPPIEKLFKTTSSEHAEYGIRFKEEIMNIVDENKIKISSGEIEVHRKVTMLLSPFKWMQGDYGKTLELPAHSSQSELARLKLQTSNNAAYVGAIISAVFANSGCDHFPKTYGVFVGVSKKHTIDISDDYADLSERSWFANNIGKTFDIEMAETLQSSEFKHTRTSRIPLEIGDNQEIDFDIQEVEGVHETGLMGDVTKVFQDETEEEESENSSVSTSGIFDIESCDCEDDEEDEDDEEEPFAWASFENVPVQVTVMEKCEGTFFTLCMQNPDPKKHLAWLTQVMFALAYAQRNFAFTHNDLHANNIMYVETDKEYFYYSCGGSYFKVATYGYLIKLIDFERSIMSVKLVGMKEAKTFMSDHFSLEEEAAGQYNTEPFYSKKHAEIKANPSFDLVRLATSMYWDFFPDLDADYSDNRIYGMFKKWLTLEDGTSIMFGKKDPKHDRYHGFDLYKAISRFCKDAVPRKEIMTLKDVYGIESLPIGVKVCSIDF